MRHSRKGFTMLELLAVIGIILILISMAIIGYQQVDKASTSKATKTTLANAQALLAEYEINAPLTTNPAFSATFSTTPNDVNPGGADRNTSQAVLNTENVMAVLSHIPKYKQILAQLPSKSLLTNADGTPLAATTGPVLLDGWKNPVIYVPAYGLTVNLTKGSSTSSYIVRTSGVFPNTSIPPLSPNDRPFFASAGQDGNFNNGDDNLYSFQP